MSEAVLVALITGGISFLGVIIANNKNQAVTDTKLEELTREVREQIKVINHRIEDLEHGGK